jgi:hypothetical protein
LGYAGSASSVPDIPFKEFGESPDDIGVFLIQILLFADVIAHIIKLNSRQAASFC